MTGAPISMRAKLWLPCLIFMFLWEGSAWCGRLFDDPIVATASLSGEDDLGLSKAQLQAGRGSVRVWAEITTLPMTEDPSHSLVSSLSAIVHRGGIADFEFLAWKFGIGGLKRSASAYSGGFLGFAAGVSHVNPRTQSEDQSPPIAENTAISIGDQVVPAAGIYLDGFHGGKNFGAHVFLGWTFLSQVKIVSSRTAADPFSNPGTSTQTSDHQDWGMLSLGVGLSFLW